MKLADRVATFSVPIALGLLWWFGPQTPPPAVPGSLLPQLAALAEELPEPPEWECVDLIVETRVRYHPPSGRWLRPCGSVPAYEYHGQRFDGFPPVGTQWPTGAVVTEPQKAQVLDVVYRMSATVLDWVLGRAPLYWRDPPVNR